MPMPLAAEAPPLTADAAGVLRVGGTRISLDHVLALHRSGLSPEQIVERCDTLALADVYAAIGYTLRHPAEVEAYLSRQAAEAEAVRSRIESAQPPFPSRAELQARHGVAP